MEEQGREVSEILVTDDMIRNTVCRRLVEDALMTDEAVARVTPDIEAYLQTVPADILRAAVASAIHSPIVDLRERIESTRADYARLQSTHSSNEAESS